LCKISRTSIERKFKLEVSYFDWREENYKFFIGLFHDKKKYIQLHVVRTCFMLLCTLYVIEVYYVYTCQHIIFTSYLSFTKIKLGYVNNQQRGVTDTKLDWRQNVLGGKVCLNSTASTGRTASSVQTLQRSMCIIEVRCMGPRLTAINRKECKQCRNDKRVKVCIERS